MSITSWLFRPGRLSEAKTTRNTKAATKDDQRHMLTRDQIQEFARAGTQLLFVVIQLPGLTIRGKKALHGDCIDS